MQLSPVHQTLFGSIDAPLAERGNCFPACIASILGVDLSDVPHWYGQDTAGDGDADWWAIVAWLQGRGTTIFAWDWSGLSDFMHRSLTGAVVILSGDSPRFVGTSHAVIGQLDGRGGWRLLHDPHPSGDGISGDPSMVELVIPLVRSNEEAANG